jgi:hypothetical protein
VTVSAVEGISATSINDIFTYGSPTPTVTSINPTSGPGSGGTSVTITGTNFNSSSTVSFGNTFATGVTVNNSTSITATSPAGSGTVNVTVTTAGHTDAQTNNFTYVGFQEMSAPTTFTTNGSVTAGYGFTPASGDLLLLVVCNNQENGAPVNPVPTGWTSIGDNKTGAMGAVNSIHCTVYGRTSTGETSVTFTSQHVVSTIGGEAWVIDYAKGSGSYAKVGAGATTSGGTGAISPTTVNVAAGNVPAVEIELAISLNSSMSLTDPGGFASEGTSTGSPSSTVATLGVADAQVTSAGTPATATWNTGNTAAWVGYVAVFK